MTRQVSWSAESRAQAAERMRKLNADMTFKEKLRKIHADPAFKKAASERMRKLNADPAFKEKHRKAASERMRKLSADPAFRKAASERARKLNADPAFKEKHHFLVGLSNEERAIYRKVRSHGITKEAALAIIHNSRAANGARGVAHASPSDAATPPEPQPSLAPGATLTAREQR